MESSKRVPTATIRRLLKIPDAFRAWLLDRDPDSIVGDCYTPDNTPVANFLWDAIGVYVWVADDIMDGDRFIDLPEWCRRYQLAEYDYAQTKVGDSGELTDSEVLAVLDKAAEEC
jgi:hypothetical protein